MRNTPVELETYPPALRSLVRRVADEYGLIIVGWSATWDVALREALRSAPSRRYPHYWVAHNGHINEEGRPFVSSMGAHPIVSTGADEFFVDLGQRLARLDVAAVRRGRPRFRRDHQLTPDARVAPQGWRVLPLLQVRTASSLGPVGGDEGEIILPPQRRRVIDALNDAPLTSRLRTLARTLSPTHALGVALAPEAEQTVTVALVDEWDTNAAGRQTLNQASFRLGGDAAGGVSCLASLRPPSGGTGAVNFTIDVGLSLESPVSATEAAGVIRDGLVLVTAALPEALFDVPPPDAAVLRAEVHFLAASTDGQAANRPNDMANRIDFTPFGTPPPQVGEQMGFAVELSSPLTETDAGELIVVGLQRMLIDMGWIDPTASVEEVRKALGLPASSRTAIHGG